MTQKTSGANTAFWEPYRETQMGLPNRFNSSTSKETMIALVRRAQNERDPRKKDALWQVIRELGPVHNATVIEDEIIGKEESDDRP